MRHGFTSLFLAAAATLVANAEHLGKSLSEWQSLLASEDRVERLIASRSIGEMAVAGDRAATKVVVWSLTDRDPAVRFWGAVALGEMDGVSRSAKARLREATEDEASEVQVAAALALVKVGETEGSVEALIRVLEGPEATARLHAAHALDDIGDAARPAVPALQKAVSDEFGYVGRVARHALFELGERPCPYQQCE